MLATRLCFNYVSEVVFSTLAVDICRTFVIRLLMHRFNREGLQVNDLEEVLVRSVT